MPYILLKIKNFSHYPSISVLLNDEILFGDILIHSPKKLVPCGTSSVCVFDNHGKKFLDLWLPLIPYIDCPLEIYDNYVLLNNTRFS